MIGDDHGCLLRASNFLLCVFERRGVHFCNMCSLLVGQKIRAVTILIMGIMEDM